MPSRFCQERIFPRLGLELYGFGGRHKKKLL
jgi:hypothetical protein